MGKDAKNNAGERQDEGLVGRIWRFFSSVRLALSLIMVISGLSLIGALIVQVPSEYAAAGQYSLWLEEVIRPRFGIWTDLLSLLGLFNVFHSLWFLGAGTLLVINILVCSLNRWQRISNIITGGQIRHPESFYSAGGYQAEATSKKAAPAGVTERYAGELKKQGYRVRTDSGSENICLAADKNRYFPLGTYLGHLSLILLILGFAIGGYAGFREHSFIVTEGSSREVGHGTALSLRLDSFVDEYWPDGSPKDYRSEVVLFQAGSEVKKATVRVNYPLSYGGIRFYQSFFGPAVKIQVRSATGSALFDETVALANTWTSMGYQRPVGTFDLPNGYLINVFGPAVNAADPMLGQGELAVQVYQSGAADAKQVAFDKLDIGTPMMLADFEFTYLHEGKFSGFQVSRDPGNALIWIASTLFMLGVGMVLYFPHRQVWAIIISTPGGGSRIRVRSTSAKHPGAGTELARLIEPPDSGTDKQHNKK